MSKTTTNPQSIIPEKYRATQRLSEDGNTVFHTIGLPRYARYQIQKKRTVDHGLEETWIEVDRAKVAGSKIAATLYEYGEKRMTYDGFQIEKLDDQSPEGIVAGALEWAENQLRYFYGERSKQYKGSSAPKVVRMATKILVESIIAGITDDKGKRYTKKSLPDFVKESKTLDEVKKAAEQFGIGKKATAKIIAAAEASCPDLGNLSL